MRIGRAVGWLLIAAGLIFAAWEVWGLIATGHYRPLSAGELWYRLAPGSLTRLQAGVQRYLLPALWDPVIVTVLLAPVWAVLGLPGGLLVVLCRRRRRRWFSS